MISFLLCPEDTHRLVQVHVRGTTQPHNLLLVPFIYFIYLFILLVSFHSSLTICYLSHLFYLFIYFIYLFLPTMASHWIHLLVCVASWQITQKVAKDNRLPWGIKYFVSLLSSQMETLGHQDLVWCSFLTHILASNLPPTFTPINLPYINRKDFLPVVFILVLSSPH